MPQPVFRKRRKIAAQVDPVIALNMLAWWNARAMVTIKDPPVIVEGVTRVLDWGPHALDLAKDSVGWSVPKLTAAGTPYIQWTPGTFLDNERLWSLFDPNADFTFAAGFQSSADSQTRVSIGELGGTVANHKVHLLNTSVGGQELSFAASIQSWDSLGGLAMNAGVTLGHASDGAGGNGLQNQWAILALTRRGNDLRGYVNGQPPSFFGGPINVPSQVEVGGETFRVGFGSDFGAQFWWTDLMLLNTGLDDAGVEYVTELVRQASPDLYTAAA